MHPPTSREKNDITKEILGNDFPAESFQSYFRHYFDVLCLPSTGVAVVDIHNPALNAHSDVLKAAKRLRDNPDLTLSAFAESTFAGTDILPQEREHAVHAVVNAAFMVDATFSRHYTPFEQHPGHNSAKWEAHQTFPEFMQHFAQLQIDQVQASEAQTLRHQKPIKAWKLRKRHRIEIIGTDNILEHLNLDPAAGSLKVFHHVAFLRAHLRRSRESRLDLSPADSLKLGVLPPQLVLETLASFHLVLFPVVAEEKRSRALLKKLIKDQAFDPDTLWVEYIREIPHNFTFTIWGNRIRQLHDIVKKRPPRNALSAWFERHASDRNILIAAVIGLLFAGVFGLLSFLVGVAQFVLSWYAWRYPVNSESG
ncbi:hypothetical protein MN608_05311 [Microdochium nivale]|nr:hypothetical protein MN608_05311 [Microdochium nivale]